MPSLIQCSMPVNCQIATVSGCGRIVVILFPMTISNSFRAEMHHADVPSAIVGLLRRIDLAQGSTQRMADDAPLLADSLAARSRIDSVIASNELEGIRTERRRAEQLIRDEITPNSRDEQEIAGYRVALDDVIANPREPVTVPRLLHWHRELFRYAGPEVAGRFKRSENRVLNPDGSDRFRTVEARLVEPAVVDLTERAEEALREEVGHPVLVTAVFTLDLLVIHPFEDGNGRTARIASNAMLARADYQVGRYVSIEQLLGDRRNAYYRSLLESTHGWHEGVHSIWPWTEFFCAVVLDAYTSLERRLRETNPQDHRALVTTWLLTDAPATFSIGDAKSALAGIPVGAIRGALNEARSMGAIDVSGVGRGAKWVLTDRSRLRRPSGAG